MGRGAEGWSLWNFAILSCAFFKFFTGSQVSSSLGNPFQCTKYSTEPRWSRESLISSTSYSISLLIITGGGGGGLTWDGYRGGLYIVSRDSLNTGCVDLQASGNLELV